MNESCGCCEGTQPITPEPIVNRPGLDQLSYRMGRYGSFLETMKARLARYSIDIQPDMPGPDGKFTPTRIYPLQGLTSRESSDPSIALLDAWAVLADVLTFYQERIANEGYLRTATERRSILELARLVGYKLRPGVSATVYLAYTVDPKTTTPVTIPPGTKAQSVPGPGELPQTFETADPLEARAAWNILQPRLSRPQTRASIENASTGGGAGGPRVYLKGTATSLSANDPLLIQYDGDSMPVLYRVLKVNPEPAYQRTRVDFQPWRPRLGQAKQGPNPAAMSVYAFERLDALVKSQQEDLARIIEVGDEDMANQVKRIFADLQSKLDLRGPFPELEAYIENTVLPNLKELAGAASAKLAHWTVNLMSQMDATIQAAVKTRSEANAYRFVEAAAPAAVQGKGNGNIPLAGNESLQERTFQELVKLPSNPPRTALALQQSLAAQFLLRSDANLRVLNAFHPGASEQLPALVANLPVTPKIPIKAYALKAKAALFGHNARQPKVVSADTGGGYTLQPGDLPTIESTWTQLLSASPFDPVTQVIALDAVYDRILPDSYIAVEDIFALAAGQAVPTFQVGSSSPITLSSLSTAAKVSVLYLKQDWMDQVSAYADLIASSDTLPGTTVYAQSEELPLAEEPIASPICGSDDPTNPDASIELDGLYSELKAGRWLIISGERADIQAQDPDHPGQPVAVPGIQSSELVMLAEVQQKITWDDNGQPVYNGPNVYGEAVHTFIRLATKLEFCYQRETVKIYGNVVKATHGETRNETMGSGDASQTFQSFTLKQQPLTYVAAAVPAGVVSTLKVRVNGVEWHEVGSLAEVDPTGRSFTTSTADDDKTTVIFGNGNQGQRPSTGIENIKAVYRNGIGSLGNVKPGQVSLLVTRPLGVKEVVNPMRGAGGADRENRDQARKNVPQAILALDRLVSTQDYADFARTFAGIGKASAARLTDGHRQVVYVTIAGANDIPINPTTDLYQMLVKALKACGDPYQPLVVQVRELVMIVISANIRVLPDYQWETVAPSVRASLLDTFSFERRELGQDVLLSEIITAIQAVPGVDYVDLDLYGGVSENDDRGLPRTPEDISNEVSRLVADAADLVKNKRTLLPRLRVHLTERLKSGVIAPAQLAFLTPAVEGMLILNEVKA